MEDYQVSTISELSSDELDMVSAGSLVNLNFNFDFAFANQTNLALFSVNTAQGGSQNQNLVSLAGGFTQVNIAQFSH